MISIEGPYFDEPTHDVSDVVMLAGLWGGSDS